MNVWRWLTVTLVLLLGCLAVPNTALALEVNLVQNGSFEQGQDPGSSFSTLKAGSQSIQGWRVSKGTIDYIGGYFKSSDGGRHVDLDGTPGAGGVDQMIRTMPGHLYQLTFDLAANPQCSPTNKTLGLTIGNKKHTISRKGGVDWLSNSIQFVATMPQTYLLFESLDEPAASSNCGMLLDKVAVVDITPMTAQSFEGKWQTNWGTMDLRLNGLDIIGHYDHDQGRIMGTLSPDGRMFQGLWSESPSYRPPDDGGLVQFSMSDDGQHINGLWSYGNSKPSQEWTGSRIK